jgi:hypothetical protein
MNTTRYARYARGFIAGTQSVSDMFKDLSEGIEVWATELEAGGFWHQWDQDAYCNRKRFTNSGCTRFHDGEGLKGRVIDFLNTHQGAVRKQVTAGTGISRQYLNGVLKELTAKHVLREEQKQLYLDATVVKPWEPTPPRPSTPKVVYAPPLAFKLETCDW